MNALFRIGSRRKRYSTAQGHGRAVANHNQGSIEVKKAILGMTALAATALAVPALTATAEAHPRGERCYYQYIDRDHVVRTRSDYCHHLPWQFRAKPRSGFSLFFDFGDGWYYGRGPRSTPRGQDQVCLVTFFKKSQVEAGADVNVERARVLPRHVARRMDGPNDRQRIFDYGTNKQTRETCRYLNNINN